MAFQSITQVNGALNMVRPGTPRTTAQVWFDDGRIYEAPVGTPLEAYIKAAEPAWPLPVMAALIDDELRELTYHCLLYTSPSPRD